MISNNKPVRPDGPSSAPTATEHDTETEVAEAICATCGRGPDRRVPNTFGEATHVSYYGQYLGSVSELLAGPIAGEDCTWYPKTAGGALGPKCHTKKAALNWLRMRGAK